MILTPTVNDTAQVLVTPEQAAKASVIEVEIPSGGNTVKMKYDGSSTALTFANGRTYPGGSVLRIERVGSAFHNAISGICDTGVTQGVVIHIIE